ncbi:MAG TPA: hypothetical protein VMA83_09520 [Solirubrobacteraceae bacterium]|nr:hypothetical protein [Solirubrobacteraceae bacterium]
MNGAEVALVVSVFLASLVEAVEAVTIVLAVGTTRAWDAALYGAGAALALLAVLIALLGRALERVPLETLHVAVGVLLLAIGLQWLRKAVLRAAGRKALHDERAEFREQSDAARRARGGPGGLDRYSLSVAFKGVLVEGLEVALIVVTLGAARDRIGLAAAAAILAALVAAGAGAAVRAPLARVPENAMKFAVGVMLCSFGVFWLGSGLGVSWPGGDAMLLALIAGVLAAALISVRALAVRA